MNIFNHEQIAQIDIPERSKTALSIMLEKHPKLKNIALVQGDIGQRAAIYHHGDIAKGESNYVAINENWNTAIVNKGLNALETQPLREIIQKNLGVEEITPDLLMTFVLLHEYGHGYFYYGMTLEEKRTFDESTDNDFANRYGAVNLAGFDKNFPTATPAERLTFARAYRNRVKEQRADSLACEILQQVARQEPTLFPEITNLTKNYS
jgi:hypothetical protein